MEIQNEVKVFQQGYVDKLYREAISTNNFDSFLLDVFPYEEKFPKGTTGIFVPEKLKLQLPDGRNKRDFENSIVVYNALKTLNETQASDERLWTYLTLVTFWDYMRKRWPLEKAIEDKENGRLKDRYFLRVANIESLTRNGIARLWWYSHLTYDETRSNPFELTEVLLRRADLSVGITERALGSSKKIRTALLEFLRDNPEISANEVQTRETYKMLNLIGGVRNLPFLEVSEIRDILDRMKGVVASAA